MPSRATRLLRTSLVAVVVVAAIATGITLGVRALLRTATKPVAAADCTVGSYAMSSDQASVAATMVGVVLRRALPERASVMLIAAGLQESKLTNLASGSGDRDSVGVLQQRPSQGWGTIAELSDVHYAAGAFLDAMQRHADWQTGALADVIQEVQVSADGTAYAKHEPEAQALADALTGTTPAALDCRLTAAKHATAPSAVAASVQQDLPVNEPAITATTVSVPGAAWATAAWFVANAERSGIEQVAYSGRQWTRTNGWQTRSDAPSGAVLATLHT